MHWSSGLAKLTQEHTVMRTHTHRCTSTRVHTHTVTQSCKLFGAQLCSSPVQSSASAAGLHLWNTGTHTAHAFISYSDIFCTCKVFFSKKPSCIKLLCCHILLVFTKALFYQNTATLLAPRFFTSVFYLSRSHLPFWRWAADRVEKSCGWQLHCQYSAVSWEETKCISQSGGNVTVLVIRAFKLAALPKHCQTLCERGEILTVLSPLIVGA